MGPKESGEHTNTNMESGLIASWARFHLRFVQDLIAYAIWFFWEQHFGNVEKQSCETPTGKFSLCGILS